MMDSSVAVSFFKNVQGILGALAVLNLIGYQWPKPAVVKGTHNDTFDFVIVGAGTAGCVIANRLIELGNVSVLLIEAGGNPPFESDMPGLFPYIKKTSYDWNFGSTATTNPLFSFRDNVVKMAQGKVIGGSGSLSYMGYERGNKHDYDKWAEITKDSTWSWQSVLPAFQKNEQLLDEKVLNSPDKCFYGTEGNIKINTQYFKRNDEYFAAFKELGWGSPLDINTDTPLGFTNVMFSIGDGVRQSTARKFLSPIKDDPNLHLMTNTLATKVIFDDNKRAVGVEVVNNNNEVITVKANIEVIVSAGAFKSPQLLMLSGIGPKDHLESKCIKVIADLPVGQNFQDHVNALLLYAMPKAEKTVKLEDPHKYPFTIFDGYNALNKTQTYPDYEVIGVSFGESNVFMGFCAFYFNYNEEICDHLSKQIEDSQILLVIVTHLYPKSRGEVCLASTNPHDHPTIVHGYYTDDEDVINHSNYIQDFNHVLETSYFKSVDAKLIMPALKSCEELDKGSDAYWRCYTVGMSDTSHYYVGSCGMGSVLDSRLRVLGVNSLRVIDASSFPDTIGTTTEATVIMLC